MSNNDAVLLRRQIADELKDIDSRRVVLVDRLRTIDAAADAAAKEADAAKGLTNACKGHWREDDTCSYCGSMGVARAIELLKTQGTAYSGADWKYGWPHKFYIGQKKFYHNHLEDATSEQLEEYSKLSDELLGVSWDSHEGEIRYRAVPGIQKWGVVGSEEEKGAGVMKQDAEKKGE
jgi:hypothetical protein